MQNGCLKGFCKKNYPQRHLPPKKLSRSCLQNSLVLLISVQSKKRAWVTVRCHELWINVWIALLHMYKANLYHWSSRELLPFWTAHSWQSSVTVNPGIGDTIYCKRGSCERRCLQFCCLCSSTFLPQAMAEVPVNSEQFWAPNLLLNLC